jgi:phospholipase/carboxylesterase
MTAADLALHLPPERRVAGVCMISGAPIVVEEWAEKAIRHKGLPVFISHGTRDPVLPYVASNWSRDLLQRHGLDVQHESHTGAHELGPPHILSSLANFIAKCIKAQ